MADTTHIAEVLASILDTACSCLDDTPYGRPTDCYISHGQPPDDCCDFLAIWVERLRPSHGFADGQYITGGKLWSRCDNLSFLADISLRLVRPCFPTLIDDANNPFPPAEEIQAAAEALAIDIRILQCCLMDAQANGLLLPTNTSCLELGVGDATPHGPEGGCAGWTWDLAVELEVCC